MSRKKGWTLISVAVILGFLFAQMFLNTTPAQGIETQESYFLTNLQINTPGHALEWNRTWDAGGEDRFYAVDTGQNGSVYVVGVATNVTAGVRNPILVKYNSTGHLLWNRTWGWIPDSWGVSEGASGLVVDKYENIYVAGYSWQNAFAVKYNPSGEQLWNFTWATSSAGSDLVVDAYNNSYLGGRSGMIYDALCMKLNATGGLAWNSSWGSTGDEVGYDITFDDEGYLYLVGCKMIPNNDIFLLKINSTGHVLNNWTWGGPQNDFAYAICFSNMTKELYITGRTHNFGATSGDIFILKYNTTGFLLANYTWGGVGGDFGNDIVIGRDDYLYLTGETNSFGNGWQAFLVKFGTNGTRIWNVTWGGGLADRALGLTVDTQNNIYFAGETRSAGLTIDAFLVKYGRDTDLDGLTDDSETYIYKTNVTNPDSDGDGLSDYAEVLTYFTNATNSDSDDDLIHDKWEVDNQLDPWNATDALDDFDRDLLTNFEEYTHDTDPWNPDSDRDGMPDGWEVANVFNPMSGADNLTDADADDLPNLYEYRNGTNPHLWDTDGEGLSDGDEINVYRTNATNPDSDGDGYDDKAEIDADTNPNDPASHPSTGIPFGGMFLILMGIGLGSLISIEIYKYKKGSGNYFRT